MTARENVGIGALFGSAHARRGVKQAFALADEVLALVGLKAKADQPVSALTIPDRKRLEVARAVATRPQLLLLDEVMAGLNNVEIDEALEMVRSVHATGVTVLLIEHVMRVIVGVCRRAIVLDSGQVLAQGEPEVVLRDERVIQAYLGERYAKRLKSS
jgi:branched-chain amino acid transport system ATP-binding protein